MKPLQLNSNNTADDEIDLLQITRIVWNGKWTIIFFSLLFFILSFIYAYGKVPVYRADALLQVEAKKASIPGIEELTGLTEDDASVGTELEIIKSRKTLGQAVDALKLDITAHPNRIRIIGNFYKRFFNKDGLNKPPSLWKSFDNYIKKFAWGNEKIKVESLIVPNELINSPLTLITKKNNQFDIVTEDQEFLLTGRIGKQSKSKDGTLIIFVSEVVALPDTHFIIRKRSRLNTIGTLKRKIRASEKGKKTGIINLELEGTDKNIIVRVLDHISQTYLEQNKSRSSEEATSALKFLKEQIIPVKSVVDEAEGNLSKYRTDNQTADLSLETQAVLDVVTGIDTELQKLSLAKEELSQRYTINHPKIQAISSQEKRLIKRKEKSLSKVSRLPVKQQKLLKLERDFKVSNTIYNEILNNIQEFKIAEASSLGNVYIVDSAVTNNKPVKPKKALLIAVGTLLGIILGLFLVFLRKYMHRTIDNPEKLEEALGIPVYATVPLSIAAKQSSKFKIKHRVAEALLASDDINDPAIESLRSLRTSLHFALLESKNNIVMITGPSPSIGKSFITSNFSAVIAASEKRTLLIDADMRKGYLHDLMGREASPGLSDLISNNINLEDVIHTVNINGSNLDILTRGKIPPNPSELLMHSNFDQLLSEASKQYDLVLIDTPPVHAVTDPTIIGKHAGVVFMVVHANKHHVREIEHAVKRMAQNGTDIKGFIFNGYVAKNDSYGYDYGYNNYYAEYKN